MWAPTKNGRDSLWPAAAAALLLCTAMLYDADAILCAESSKATVPGLSRGQEGCAVE